MSKYSFKPYNPLSPELFQNEKDLLFNLLGSSVQIEHIGSTAVPGLGGKGIIDIAVGVSRHQMQNILTKVSAAGYEYKPAGGDENRLFFLKEGSTEENVQVYHLHIIDIDSSEWNKNIKFRDWLKSHPEDVKKYAEAKRLASQVDDVDKEKYMMVKEPVIKEILQKALAD